MKWEPKYSDLKQRALYIARSYNEYTKINSMSSYEAIKRLAGENKLSIKSIYRYLSYVGVNLSGRIKDNSVDKK